MKVTVCIGSSCHIKGSRPVVEELQNLIAESNLGDKVCVTVDDQFFSVSPDTVKEFFEKEIKGKA